MTSLEWAEELESGRAGGESLCWVYYTSGSTGRPKGVLCEHRNAIAYLRAHPFLLGGEEAATGAGLRVLVVSAFTFDPAAGDAFFTLARGGVVCVAGRARMMADLLGVLVEQGVTHVCSTPAVWRALPYSPQGARELRVVALGGEAMAPSVVEALAPHLTLLNVYGTTEGTVYQTARRLLTPADNPRLLGEALRGMEVRVEVDGREACQGEVGEIVIAGGQVARGYAQVDALSAAAQAFRGRPEDGRRCYHTGDLGRRTEEGLELLGRADSQVKVNGVRVEGEEVEAVLTRLSLVHAALVSLDPSRRSLSARLLLSPPAQDALYALHWEQSGSVEPGGSFVWPEDGVVRGPLSVASLRAHPTVREFVAHLRANNVHLRCDSLGGPPSRAPPSAPPPQEVGAGKEEAKEAEGGGREEEAAGGGASERHAVAALYKLAAEGSGELISALLAACPPLSPDALASRSAGGSGPLHVAAAAANLDALHALLAHRASLTISTPAKVLPAHIAAGSCPQALAALLEAGTPLRVRDASKQTLLHHAARGGQPESIALILARGGHVDLDLADKWNRTPLHWAVLNGHVGAVTALLEAGAAPTPRQVPDRVHRSQPPPSPPSAPLASSRGHREWGGWVGVEGVVVGAGAGRRWRRRRP